MALSNHSFMVGLVLLWECLSHADGQKVELEYAVRLVLEVIHTLYMFHTHFSDVPLCCLLN